MQLYYVNLNPTSSGIKQSLQTYWRLSFHVVFIERQRQKGDNIKGAGKR